MPRFIVSVELDAAGDDDYERLDEAMEQVGFSRKIKRASGLQFRLPRAEYYVRVRATHDEVRDWARYAAGKTGRAAAVLVIQADRIYWAGLREA